MLKSVVGKFPFSIGTTSYILDDEEDNLIKNIDFLKDSFNVVQLLYFGIDYLDELLNEKIIQKLIDISKKSKVEFIAHLPLDLDLLNSDKKVISRSVDAINYISEKTGSLGIKKFIIHIDRYKDGKQLAIKLDNRVKDLFYNVLVELEKRVCIKKEKICIENTNYDLTFMKDIIKDRGFRVCFDIGHLILQRRNFDDFIEIFGDIIDVVHFHGVKDKKDHLAVSELSFKVVDKVFRYLSTFKKAVIIEVFSLENLVKSIDFMINSDCLLKN